MAKAKPTPVVVANWKCNGSETSIKKLVDSWNKSNMSHDVECYVACPFVYLSILRQIIDEKKFKIAAQNCIPKSGAFTGEISVSQLSDCRIDTVIIGHSERRIFFNETEKVIGEKCHACVQAGIQIVVCIGEGLKDYTDGKTRDVVKDQMQTILQNIPKDKWQYVVIAYEPVWAIGTGKVAMPSEVQLIHEFIRTLVAEHVSAEVGRKLRILYGGSITGKTSAGMYAMPDVNGFLVGGASLSDDFLGIIHSTNGVIKAKL